MHFRKDLNGLRAIAVIAVVLFHFDASWMPGGFAGVDVFFVISGFLMTGIIFHGLEENNFSILRFYYARANRIIPPLAFLCFSLLIFGWFFLIPIDYETLGKHVAGSVTFFSNIMYWHERGYFDSLANEKWLLHTWSLSIEWQFYILYPLILLLVRKIFSINSIKYFIVVATVLAFIFSIISTYKWPDASYFLLSTRAWEMLIGGIAFLYPIVGTERWKRALEFIGFSLIIISYFFISSKTPWPGYMAFFPVFGAFLIIQSNRSNSSITGNLIFQRIGEWSYSIYLWHWPLLVAMNYYSFDRLYVLFGLLVSMALFFLSYVSRKYINHRNYDKSVNNTSKLSPVYMSLIVASVGMSIAVNRGYYFRLSEELKIKNINVNTAINDWRYPRPNLKVGGSEIRFLKGSTEKNILFIGASHVEQTYPYVESLNSKYNVYYLTKGGCFVTYSSIRPEWNCNNVNNYKDIIEGIRFDKIVNSFYLFDKGLSDNVWEKSIQIEERIIEYNKFIQFSKNNSMEVFIILGEPFGDNFSPIKSIRHNLDNFISTKDIRAKYQLQYDSLNHIHIDEKVTIIDPIEFLCSDVCLVMDENNRYYYKDSSHMRPWYARKSLNYLDIIFE